jgi:hypothetical protein
MIGHAVIALAGKTGGNSPWPPTESCASATTFAGLPLGTSSSAARTRPQSITKAIATSQLGALMTKISLSYQTDKILSASCAAGL